jgi:hypothetical protein
VPPSSRLEVSASTIEDLVSKIEKDEPPPEDVVFWTVNLRRLLRAVDANPLVICGPQRTYTFALVRLTELVMLEILKSLQDRRSITREKVMLKQLAKIARELGEEVDTAIANKHIEETESRETTWMPVTDSDSYVEVMDSDNSNEVLWAILIASARIGVDLNTLELGLTGDVNAIRAIRGLVQ